MSDRTISALWLITSFIGFLAAIASLGASAPPSPWQNQNAEFCYRGEASVAFNPSQYTDEQRRQLSKIFSRCEAKETLATKAGHGAQQNARS
jgi:hypothetical protein